MGAAQERFIWDPPEELIGASPKQNPLGLNLRVAAEDWIAENPEVYELLKRYAREAVRRGKPFGVKWIVERARWEFVVSRGEEDFALNNNLTAYVARALAEEVPGMRGLVKFRKTLW